MEKMFEKMMRGCLGLLANIALTYKRVASYTPPVERSYPLNLLSLFLSVSGNFRMWCFG